MKKRKGTKRGEDETAKEAERGGRGREELGERGIPEAKW